MKARIKNTAVKKLLAVGLTSENEEQIRTVCAELGAELIAASAEDMDKCPAELFGENAYADDPNGETAVPPETEMLMFAGFDRRQLDDALDRLKAAGVRIPLKAVYTPHNRLWMLSHLIGELRREHEYMTKGRQP